MWFQNFYDTFYKCFIKEDRYQLLLDGIGVTVKVSLLAVVFRHHSGNANRYTADDYLLCHLCFRALAKVGDCCDCIRDQFWCICFRDHSGRDSLCGQGTDGSRSFAGLKRQTNHDSDCRSAGCKEYFPSTLQRIYHLDQGNGDCWLCWLGRHSESRRLHQDLYV